jgi:hypothetical protein
MGGKVIRGTIDTEVSYGLCLLAVFLPGEGVVLAQVAIESKQNEITAAPTLLGCVDLRNKVVIGDALHTQRQVSIQIGKAGGNYIWTVKGNQPQLQQDLRDWFDHKVELLPGMALPTPTGISALPSPARSREMRGANSSGWASPQEIVTALTSKSGLRRKYRSATIPSGLPSSSTMTGIGASPLKVGSGRGVTNEGASSLGVQLTILRCGHSPWMQKGFAPRRAQSGAAGQMRITRRTSTPRMIPMVIMSFRFMVECLLVELCMVCFLDHCSRLCHALVNVTKD